MKTTKDEIMMVALRLFSQRGFEAVSTSMIADRLGITKGALYRHFGNKQEIFDSLIARMVELDAKQAEANKVPAGTFEQDAASYKTTAFVDLCAFVNEQFVFWTENEFALCFRRMLMLEQYKCEKMNKLYRDVLTGGPVQYTEHLLEEMISGGALNEEAKQFGARKLAIVLLAPLMLMLQLFDAGEDNEKLKRNLNEVTTDFSKRWMK